MTIRRRARLDPRQVRDLRGAGGLAIGGGLGGVLLVALFLLLGGNPSQIPLDNLANQQVQPGQGAELSECQTGEDAAERDDCRILGYVNSIQAYWEEALPGYRLATTTFFDGSVNTDCGAATSEVGPFYCPADKNVYIDLGFFRQLQTQFGAEGGPFAEAYVIAHEYGHHVQDLVGLLGGGGGTGPESQSVRIELQADCLAGVWGANAVSTGFLEPITPEQVQQAIDAARSVGDDRIQEETTGNVNPDKWTHGSAEQRAEWFRNGMDAGNIDGCNTFGAEL
jgi:predicted metalloprotease